MGYGIWDYEDSIGIGKLTLAGWHRKGREWEYGCGKGVGYRVWIWDIG
jgi:hypothetical protein